MAGLVLSGTNWAATNDKAALDITGDIDIRVAVAMTDWTPAATQCLTGKWPGGGTAGGYKFVLLATGILRLSWTETGPTGRQADSTVAPTVSDGALLLVRVTLDVNDGGGNRVIQFFTRTSTTGAAFADASSDAGWTQLGTTITTAGTTNIVATTDGLAAGSEATTGGQRVIGTEYAVVVKSGIAGTTVANPDFNANTPTFTDGSGNVWYAVSTTQTDITLGLSEESDTAFGVTPSQPTNDVTVGLATETDTALPIDVSVDRLPLPITQPRGRFGCGEYSAYIGERGGGQLNLEIAWTSISITKVVNGAGSVRMNIPQTATSRSPCCEVVAKSEPWRDEVIVYRGDELAFAGPLQSVGGSESPNCFAPDLYAWMSKRFIEEDMHFEADVSDIFHGIFDAMMAKDPSPNITINTRQTGVRAVRDYVGKELNPAETALSELASTALDFTMIGRKLVAGGLEVFLEDEPLILHDQGVISAEPIKDGTNFANDVAILAATVIGGELPVNGRATLGQSVYGLVQRVYTQLQIRDGESADANAMARAQAWQPIPYRLKVVLSPDAPFEYKDAIPGRQIDVRLGEAAGCMEIDQLMRIVQVTTDVSEGVDEKVSLDIVPVGVTE